jgi:hypothetical protein
MHFGGSTHGRQPIRLYHNHGGTLATHSSHKSRYLQSRPISGSRSAGPRRLLC